MIPKPRRRRKARKPLSWKRTAAKAAGGLDPDTWQAIVAWYGGLCGYCETSPWEQQDHIIPIAKGGQHTASNVVPACRYCNDKKGVHLWPVRRRHPFMAAVVEGEHPRDTR